MSKHKAKRHLEVNEAESRCRQPGSTKNMTKDPNSLTCGNCLAIIEKDAKKQKPAS